MSQIQVNNLTFGYDGCFENVFENLSFNIDTDWKLGLIGRNGKGKQLFINYEPTNHLDFETREILIKYLKK